MNKRVLRLVALAGITSCSIIFSVHEVRTPLGLNSRLNLINGSIHYPLSRVKDECAKWSVDIWGGAYYRRADFGMAPRGCDCCDNNSYLCNPCGNVCGRCGVYDLKSMFPNVKNVNNCCDYCVPSCGGGCCSDCRDYVNPACLGLCTSSDVCCVDEDACNPNKIPLSMLWFGKAEFRGEEVFGNGSLIGRPTDNPWLVFSKLRPRFDYNERGVVLGFHAERAVIDTKWRFGFNVSLPIKTIEIERTVDCCCLEKEDPDMDNLVAYRTEDLPVWEACQASYNTFGPDSEDRRLDFSRMGVSFSYRLDFLSTLLMPDGSPLVEYGDGSLTIGRVEIAKANDDISNPVVAWKRPNGRHGVGQMFAVNLADIGDASADPNVPNPDFPVVPGIGNGSLAWDERAKFVDSQDYRLLGNCRGNQGQLFIVPVYTYLNAEVDPVGYMRDATKIKNIVDLILGRLDGGSAIDFFSDHGICFCKNEHIFGVGDLKGQCFLGYDFTDRSFGELVFELKLPTGKKNTNPRRIYWIPTGNNGHVEGRIGVGGGWRSKRWFGFHADASYSCVFNACEKRAASFVGATVKNIGPCINANVKWGYFLGHADITIFHPKNQNMGMSLGYEIYYKRRDTVCFCPCDANYEYRDLLGERYPLDARILEKNTDLLTHKIRGQFYHRWNYFELYAGASRVVAGWNGMRETEANLGCTVYF